MRQAFVAAWLAIHVAGVWAQVGDPAGFNEQKIEREASACTDDARCMAQATKQLRANPPAEEGWWDYLVVGGFVVFVWRFFFRRK